MSCFKNVISGDKKLVLMDLLVEIDKQQQDERIRNVELPVIIFWHFFAWSLCVCMCVVYVFICDVCAGNHAYVCACMCSCFGTCH